VLLGVPQQRGLAQRAGGHVGDTQQAPCYAAHALLLACDCCQPTALISCSCSCWQRGCVVAAAGNENRGGAACCCWGRGATTALLKGDSR
jgi:hypothetical protein